MLTPALSSVALDRPTLTAGLPDVEDVIPADGFQPVDHVVAVDKVIDGETDVVDAMVVWTVAGELLPVVDAVVVVVCPSGTDDTVKTASVIGNSDRPIELEHYCAKQVNR